MAKKTHRQIFRYKCTMTEEEFKTTKKAKNPNDLVSVQAYYELNPEQDDRPEDIKIKAAQQAQKLQDQLAALSFSEES